LERAYVFLDPANDGAAEGVEVAVILEPTDHFRRRQRPLHAEIAHGRGDGRRERGPKSALPLLYGLTSHEFRSFVTAQNMTLLPKKSLVPSWGIYISQFSFTYYQT
jgi:hypothetical protein